MPRKSSARPSGAAVSEGVDNRLKTYGAAAIAAGVSVLSLGAPAEANVVIARKTIPIPVGVAVSIDLNHDCIYRFPVQPGIDIPRWYGARQSCNDAASRRRSHWRSDRNPRWPLRFSPGERGKDRSIRALRRSGRLRAH